MSRLTRKSNQYDDTDYSYVRKHEDTELIEIMDKLGKLEDLMEKYELDSIERLEELIKDYDDMAKSIVEMGLGIKVEIKNRSE